MRELMVMEEAEPFSIVSSLALKELMLTYVSTKTASETTSELMSIVEAEAEVAFKTSDATIVAKIELTFMELRAASLNVRFWALREPTVRVLAEPD